MKRKSWKLLLLGGALTFIVLFGMEMSTSGIERIYGPMDGSERYTYDTGELTNASETEKRIAELEKELDDIRKIAYGDAYDNGENRRLPGMPLEEDQAAVNKIADSTSGLLQTASSKGIRFVVSLFDGLMN
ncbi:translation initiation factor 2 [Paenibacillus sp. LHD-117]|uniref:translation initiation factor 2 n=1 Tax=Paenibacillus sp. LHD-117 TaxID=3071412 RepID=UPI0027DFACB6|nr:translation initiation factor 2 [Paenibacillus sp. LHD-117]MDQ6421142.1 translation initiation factor 2 [Paenibacillus sp. LHD-117]